MEIHKIRYMFEHRMLPKWFFEDTKQFIGVLLGNKEVLYDILNDMFEKEEIENPYSKEDFDVEAAKITDNVLFVKIKFPEPESEPLCYYSYMLFDENFEKKRYYCIEKGNEAGDSLPFVCGWTANGEHINYGHCEPEEEAGLFRCVDLYTKDAFGNDQHLTGCNSDIESVNEDLEEGIILEKAIKTFNEDRTKEHLIDILEILRDSYIWIPCNAIMSDTDQERILEMIDSSEESLVRKTFSNSEDIRMVPDILQKGEDFFFPVFSNIEAMGEYGDNFSKVQKHFMEAIQMARASEKKVVGIVINAFSEPMIVDKDLFEIIESINTQT